MNTDERTRYMRQLLLPGFGNEAQERLGRSTVLVAGAGGLGSPVALYLAAAGVGRLIICDKDNVELSNLNRQILHGTPDLGLAKAVSAKQKLTKLNPGCIIEISQVSIDRQEIDGLARDADIIVDCLDNIESRLVLNAFSIATGKPFVHAGIDNWSGQLTLIQPPLTPCMECFFTTGEDTGEPKPVLGAMAGIMGTHQALAVLRYLAGMDTGLKNQLLFFDGQTMEWTKLEIRKNEDCAACSLL